MPRSGDGSQVTCRHKHGAEQRVMCRITDVERSILNKLEEGVSFLEVECQICGYDCMLDAGDDGLLFL